MGEVGLEVWIGMVGRVILGQNAKGKEMCVLLGYIVLPRVRGRARRGCRDRERKIQETETETELRRRRKDSGKGNETPRDMNPVI